MLGRLQIALILLAVATASSPGSAQEQDAESKATSDRWDQSSKAQEALRTRVLEQCGLSSGTTQYPAIFNLSSSNTIPTETMVFEVKTWTGGCVAGKREGQGVIVTREDITQDYPEAIRKTTLVKAERHYVRGKQQGLSCVLVNTYFHNDEPAWSNRGLGCQIWAGENSSAFYRKLPDGRWEETAGDNVPRTLSVLLAAGTLEAESDRIVAEAEAGKTDIAMRQFTVTSDVLDGLIAGMTIRPAENKEPVSLKGKRVALILSSNSIKELERFSKERQSLIDASAHIGQAGAKSAQQKSGADAATDALTGISNAEQRERARFIDASRPELLLQGIADALRRDAGKVVAVDDLTGLSRGEFDYALVVDWRSLTRFDLLGKFQALPARDGYDSLPASVVAGQSLGGILITPGLKSLGVYGGGAHVNWKTGDCAESKREHTCDLQYMKTLADFYQVNWLNPQEVGGTAAYWFR